MKMIKKSVKFLENKIALIRENRGNRGFSLKEKYDLELFEFMLDSFESVESKSRVEQHIAWLESEIKTLENKALKKYFPVSDGETIYADTLSEKDYRQYCQLKDELKTAGNIKANTKNKENL